MFKEPSPRRRAGWHQTKVSESHARGGCRRCIQGMDSLLTESIDNKSEAVISFIEENILQTTYVNSSNIHVCRIVRNLCIDGSKGAQVCAPPLKYPHFHEFFWGKIGQIIGCCPLFRVDALLSGESWIHHCFAKKFSIKNSLCSSQQRRLLFEF